MKSIQSTAYSVHFNADGYKHLNRYVSDNKVSTVFLLVDENTAVHCYPKLIKNTADQLELQVIQIKAGEIHKNIDTCVQVWKELTNLGADRKSLLINLGGGMVTDLGGFVAATFKRGIRFINIPTTILSMVDASVGSKTGVDLNNLKNLIGVFANPEMVLIDSDYLESLPNREKRSGLAEIIKYGLTFDSKLLLDIKEDKYKYINDLNDMIYRSIQIKNKVVLKDIKEDNLRKVLNFGHTVGHAIESYYLAEARLKPFTHGEAIAIGMLVEGYISHKLHDFPLSELDEIKTYIHNLYGKFIISQDDFNPIIGLMKHDKKNNNGTVNYILLKDVGEFIIDANASTSLVVEGLDYYNN